MNTTLNSLLLCLALAGLSAIAACTPSEPEASAPVESAPPTETEPTAQAPAETTDPTESTEAAPSVRSGSFVSGEHETLGTAELTLEGDAPVITLSDNFQTQANAPDLVVVLHQNPDVIGSTEPPAFPLQEGEYVVIAPLQSPTGSQTYAIPPDIDPTTYASVAIWCREFNATFGAAHLQ